MEKEKIEELKIRVKELQNDLVELSKEEIDEIFAGTGSIFRFECNEENKILNMSNSSSDVGYPIIY